MDWTDLVVEVPKVDGQEAECILTGMAEGGLYIEDYSDMEETVWAMAHVDLIETELLQKPKDLVRLHLYLGPEENPATMREKIQSLFAAAGVENRLLMESVRQEDWENAWKQYYHAIEVGEKLVVAPSWEECSSERVVLRMDPGMAFGTGTHETTLLCLEALEKEIKGGETLLDIGTGSGILAVGALLLGAGQAFGIDIDPMCVRVARDNAKRNGVSARYRVKEGDLATSVGGRYQIITANIVADAILRLAPALPGLMAEDGLFICSGVLTERAEEVCAGLEAVGLCRTEVREMNGWVAILARLPKAGN